MDYSHFLRDGKTPCGLEYDSSPTLGCYPDEFHVGADFADIPADARVVDIPHRLKRSKVQYTNWEALAAKRDIEILRTAYLDEEKLDIYRQLPNLRVLELSLCDNPSIPPLTCLEGLEVLLLHDVSRTPNLAFVEGMSNLKTLSIDGFKHLTDLGPTASLAGLKELSICLFLMSGGYSGGHIESLEPLAHLRNLEYLRLAVKMANRNYDPTPILGLTSLVRLNISSSFRRGKASRQSIIDALPNLDDQSLNELGR